MAQRKLDDWLRTYLLYTSFSEAPDIFNFWAGVGTLAGALRRKVQIDQEYFVWTPNFYIIMTAPPGISTKSTAMNQGMKLLREIDGVKFGASSLTWQSLIQELEGATEAVPMEDGTFHPMSCLTFASSEFGSLLDPRDGGMMNVLTDLWDGQTAVWEKATKTQGKNAVQYPWLNIVACTTPDWLASNLPRQMIGGGFTSRCVFVYADYKRHLVAYPKGFIPAHIKELKKDLIHDLECISVLKGEMEMTAEAIKFGETWYEDHYKMPPKELAGNNQYGGYLARKQGHIHKLAMVISASRSDSMVVSRADLEKALRITNAVEKDLPKVFQAINTTPVMEKADAMTRMIQAHGTISKSALYSSFFHSMTFKEFEEALTSITQAGLALMEQKGNQILLSFTGEKLSSSQRESASVFSDPAFRDRPKTDF